MTRIRHFIALAALLLLAGLTACRTAEPPASDRPPDVILITIDTLRADRLGCYGYEGVETPHIDTLARDGVRFSQALAECPVTLPSHSSILTGTYPIFHGVRDNSGYRLPPEQVTLAEVLKEAGYRTGAFVGAYVLDARTGLDQGFDTYISEFEAPGGMEREIAIAEHRAERVVASAVDWLGRARPDEKSFAWIHVFDPHAPYDPPPPFDARYREDPYDGEIAYVDHALGELIRFLESRDRYRGSVISVISDHGEGLGEHREDTHGLFLYDTTMRIPWILKAPDNRHAGAEVRGQVQSIDLMPTVLRLLGIPAPGQVQGMDLLPAIEGREEPPKRHALGETLLPLNQYGWSPLLSIRSEEEKFIQGPKPELYDLRNDPGERNNLYAEKQERASELRRERRRLENELSGAAAGEAGVRVKDPAAFRRLLGLGYVAVSPPAGEAIDTESRPDPKDRIEVYDLLWSAAADFEAGRHQAALQKLNRVLSADPETFFARMLLGWTYFHLGRLGDASRELKAAASLRPDDPVAAFQLGMALASMNRAAEAEQAFRQVLELDPGNEAAMNNLGVVYMNRKRYAEAAAIYERLVSTRPRDSFAWANLGLAFMNEGRNDEALRALREAESLDPQIPQIQNNLGLALINAGRTDAAIVHYNKAIGLDPDYGQAHYNLAIALRRQGREAEAARHMEIARRLIGPGR